MLLRRLLAEAKYFIGLEGLDMAELSVALPRTLLTGICNCLGSDSLFDENPFFDATGKFCGLLSKEALDFGCSLFFRFFLFYTNF